MIEQRDLLLVPFPFSDQTGTKVRPVIVISNELFNSHSEDILVIGVTSHNSKGKYTLSLTSDLLEQGALHNPCSVKVENVLKIDKDLIIKKIGKLRKDFFEKIIANLMEIVR